MTPWHGRGGQERDRRVGHRESQMQRETSRRRETGIKTGTGSSRQRQTDQKKHQHKETEAKGKLKREPTSQQNVQQGKADTEKGARREIPSDPGGDGHRSPLHPQLPARHPSPVGRPNEREASSQRGPNLG